MRRPLAGVTALLVTLAFHSTRVEDNPPARVRGELGAMGIFALTHASPAMFGEGATDGYLTQPNLLGAARRGPLAIVGTLNFEGYTLQRGELNAGIYGEGYVDRRHPHTLLHELMLSATSPTYRGVRGSVAGGKGFTPYGTDDPMVRPFVKYPVNHHQAQVIERVQAIGAVAFGGSQAGVTLEHAFFNGDEPVDPFTAPQWSRFGDSRSTRLTVMPRGGVELQASRAFVRSPGLTQGGAYDHTQTSASLRVDLAADGSPTGGMHDHAMTATDSSSHSMHRDRRYFLFELARTDEGFGSERVFRFSSMLAEGLVEHRGWGLALRAERTDRPENERLLDPFRIPNGHADFQIIGITRWTIGSVHVAAPAMAPPRMGSTRVTPMLEVSRARPEALRTPAVFVPDEFYGASVLWSVTLGLKMHVGNMRARMGRYGVLSEAQ